MRRTVKLVDHSGQEIMNGRKGRALYRLENPQISTTRVGPFSAHTEPMTSTNKFRSATTLEAGAEA
jgi:hypothetical protein